VLADVVAVVADVAAPDADEAALVA